MNDVVIYFHFYLEGLEKSFDVFIHTIRSYTNIFINLVELSHHGHVLMSDRFHSFSSATSRLFTAAMPVSTSAYVWTSQTTT